MPRKYSGPLRTGERSAKVPRTKTKKMVAAAPRQLSQMTKLIKDIQLRESETNYKTIKPTINALDHNSITEFNLWSSGASVFPNQGTSDGERIGDRIYARSIRVRMCLDLPYDRRNVKVKMYYLPYNSDQGDPVDKAQLFHNVVNNTRLDPIQFKRWKGIKYLGTFTPKDLGASLFRTGPDDEGLPASTTVATNTATIYVNRTIKLNRKVWFKSDSSIQPSNLKEKGSILVLPYASVNTAGSDNVILSGQASFTLYFKDL